MYKTPVRTVNRFKKAEPVETKADDPRYIADLVKRIVRVSIETVKIVKKLPGLGLV